MKKILNLLFVLIVCNSVAQTQPIELIKKTFDNYKSAILNDKGEQAINYVDSRTLKYYSDILETAKTADSLAVNQLGLMDKIMVLTLRHRTPKKELLAFDGKKLFTYAIKEGMVGKNSVMNVSIGNVEVDTNFAKGQLVTNGQQAPFYFHFNKEDGGWKIDLTSILPASETAFKSVIKQSGQSENDFLLNLLTMLTGNKPNNSIWKPVI